MEQARQAIKDFMSKGGHHDTTVHESVASSVQNETIREKQREEQQVVRDREIHQDHYHTTVQPVKDREVLPEQHHHNLAGVEHRTIDHRNDNDTRERLQAEHGQFQNRTVKESSHHTIIAATPEVGSDRVHHHIHEVVQPVIHKDTIEPHVVHTTVPIHETHYNAPKHHGTSQLPVIDRTEFQHQGGVLSGRDERVHHFDGEPERHHFDATRDLHADHKHGQQTQDNSTDIRNKHIPDTYGHSGTHGSENSTVGSHSTTTPKKPSLLDKLNPMKDADGDGKKGLMD